MERQELERIVGKRALSAIDRFENRKTTDEKAIKRIAERLAARSYADMANNLGLTKLAASIRDRTLSRSETRRETAFHEIERHLDGAPEEKIRRLYSGIDGLMMYVGEKYGEDSAKHEWIYHKVEKSGYSIIQALAHTKHRDLVVNYHPPDVLT